MRRRWKNRVWIWKNKIWIWALLGVMCLNMGLSVCAAVQKPEGDRMDTAVQEQENTEKQEPEPEKPEKPEESEEPEEPEEPKDETAPEISKILLEGNGNTEYEMSLNRKNDANDRYEYFFSGKTYLKVAVKDEAPSDGISFVRVRYVWESDKKADETDLKFDEQQGVYVGKLPEDFCGTVFIQAEDMAGNVSGWCEGGGIIVHESTARHEGEIHIQGRLEDTGYRDASGNALYDEMPDIRICLQDSCSGIRQITCGVVSSSGETVYSKKLQADTSGNVTGDGISVSSVVRKANLVTELQISEQPGLSDGSYGFWIEMRDGAGHVSRWSDHFTVDTCGPALTVFGVVQNGVYNAAIRPEVQCTDENLKPGSLCVTLCSVDSGDVWQFRGTERKENALSCIVSWFETHQGTDADGAYALQIEAEDLAGHKTVKRYSFLMNRYGSIYSFAKKAQDIDGTYLTEAMDIVLTEKNLSPLIYDDIVLKVNCSGIMRELKPGQDYQVELQISDDWNLYRYTLPGKLFAEDGVYTIFAESKDDASNRNASYSQTKLALGRGAELTFAIDRTPPQILSMQAQKEKAEGGVEQMVIKAEAEQLEWKITDNLLLKEVHIYADGRELKYILQKDSYMVKLPQKEEDTTIYIRAVDAAGNRSVERFLREGSGVKEKEEQNSADEMEEVIGSSKKEVEGTVFGVNVEEGSKTEEKNMSQYPMAEKAKEILEHIEEGSVKNQNRTLIAVVVICAGILTGAIVYLMRRR